MLSSLARSLRPKGLVTKASRLAGPSVGVVSRRASPAATLGAEHRFLSTQNSQENFQAKPPTSLNMEMAQGIQNANLLILRHGVGRQRLEMLAKDDSLPLVVKWQRMMEIYLGAQLHIVAALGYETNENGIMMYTQQLAQFVSTREPDDQDEFRKIGRETWRDMLVRAFELDGDELSSREELSIVDARNIQHKVSSKLQEPAVLEMVSEKCAQIPAQSSPEIEMGMKHQVIQDVVVNNVYVGGSPSLVEELGFGPGDKGYATMQYVMAYHEADPLCQQYTSSAMIKIWQAAGLDLSGSPGAAKLPMSAPTV